MKFDVVIVGAGHAGAQAAISLKQRGFEGSIAMIGREAEPPYDRPSLSKEYLSGSKSFERMLLRPEAFWADRAITHIGGQTVDAIDPAARTIHTSEGEAYGYGRLIWAAGGDARPLGCVGGDLSGVHSIRSRADVDRMLEELPNISRVVIVGGGYIGLEAAAALVGKEKQVVLLEAQDRVLARVAGKELSRFYEAEHRAHGVDVRLGAAVDHLEGLDGWVSAVRMADGERIEADLVVVGIGIVPAVEPLLKAGADGGNGVLVDELGRTSLPHIFAVGDCALHPNRHAGGTHVRLESVQNANDLAVAVASAICDDPKPYDAVPWFWSNQYDLKLQTVGLSAGYETEVVRGDPASRSFSVIYLKAGRVVALDCINATRDYVQGRKLVDERLAIEPEALARAEVPLKEINASSPNLVDRDMGDRP